MRTTSLSLTSRDIFFGVREKNGEKESPKREREREITCPDDFRQMTQFPWPNETSPAAQNSARKKERKKERENEKRAQRKRGEINRAENAPTCQEPWI